MKQKQVNSSIKKEEPTNGRETPPIPPSKRTIVIYKANFKKKDSIVG